MRAELESAKGIRKPTDRSVMPREQVTAILRSRNSVINLFGRMPPKSTTPVWTVPYRSRTP